MASLKNIKLKILSYKKTGTVTHAMEAVSAVKMRKSQERALSSRAYAAAGLSVLERLAGTIDAQHHPLLRQQGGTACFVVITSDKGMAGSLNSGVIKLVEQEMQQRSLAKEDVAIVAFGRRAGDYFASRGYDVWQRHENISDDVSESELRALADDIIEWRAQGKIGPCFIAYQNFISTFEQVPSVRQIAPIDADMIAQFVSGIRPARGKYAPSRPEKPARPAAYAFEPDVQSILAMLVPRLLSIALFHALIENKASEHSARMVAMKSATDNAGKLIDELQLIYNKARQAAITKEISEIVGGAAAV